MPRINRHFAIVGVIALLTLVAVALIVLERQSPRAKWAKIVEGMPMEQVISFMGEGEAIGAADVPDIPIYAGRGESVRIVGTRKAVRGDRILRWEFETPDVIYVSFVGDRVKEKFWKEYSL